MFFLNPDLIERVDTHVDTVIRLTSGTEYVVVETGDEIVRRTGEFRAQILATGRRLEPLGGTDLMRPGSGWINDRMVAQAAEHGYRVVLGSVYPFDVAVRSAPFLSWYILRNVRPGSIIVLHDGIGRAERTARVLRTVLPALRARGFRVVSVSELLETAEAETP